MATTHKKTIACATCATCNSLNIISLGISGQERGIFPFYDEENKYHHHDTNKKCETFE